MSAVETSSKTENQAEGGQEVTLEEASKLAQAHHKSGNLTIAERTYKDILRAVPDHFPTVYHLASLLFQRGNAEEALKYAKLSVEVEPDTPGCWVNYGVILSVNDQHEEAIEAFDEALAIEPELYEAWTSKSYALYLLDRFEEAEEAAAQATVIDDEKPDAYINLGIALVGQEKYHDAVEVWEQLAELAPDNSKVFANWCNSLRTIDELIEAKEKGEIAVKLDENNAEAWNNLANALRDLGEFEEAYKAYKKATDNKPDYHTAHSNMALTYLEQERFPEAITAARYALSFKEDHAESLSILCVALRGMGRLDEAYQAANKAIGFHPDDALAYLDMVDVLLAMDNYDEADAVMQQALALEPDSMRSLIKLAEIRQNLDMLDEAIEALDKATEGGNETPHLLAQKARIYEQANQVDKAIEVVDHILASAPRNPTALILKSELLLTVNRKEEAYEILESARDVAEKSPTFYASMTSFKKFTEDDPDFIAMQEILKNVDNYGLDAQANIHFTLFDIYQHIKDYDKAFEHLQKANALKLDSKYFDKDTVHQGFKARKAAFNKELVESFEGLGCESDVPVFICGMPRSGTTLTEQIISSHPEVFGAGELYDLNTVVRTKGPLKHENAALMGEAYLERVKARDVTGKAKRITDKMPGNYNSIALIKCILPHAKIIVCRRNPMDNLLSCYKQNFATGHFWSYDQELAAEQYIAYNDMTDFWRDMLPEGSFLEINYEETVNNFEEQARKLIDYVGLEWDDACLEPHKQKRAVLTASKNQVIKPVYKTSVEAWRRYETQLAPMYNRLKEADLVD